MRNDINKVIKICEQRGLNYDFSESVYVTCKEKIKVTCDKKHTFMMSPDQLMNHKHSCPKCSRLGGTSKGEDELFKYISSLYKCEQSNRDILSGKELDIYIPEIKVGIEYNGLYWHREGINKTTHFEKMLLASKQKVHLIHIFEDEWLYNNKVVKTKLYDTLINTTKRMKFLSQYNTKITKNKSDKSKEVFKNNSLEPTMSFDGFYELWYNNLLVAVAPYKNDDGEITIKQIVRDGEYTFSGYIDTFLEYFILQEDTKYILCNLNWLDDLYLINKGCKTKVYLYKGVERYIKGQKLYMGKIENAKTLRKAGYAKYKLEKTYD
jgi:hypothetical protein